MAAMAAAAHAARKRAAEKAEEDEDKIEIREFADIAAVFDRYDSDGSGRIDQRELVKALGELGVTVTKKQCVLLMTKFAGDNATMMTSAQFNALVRALRATRENAVNPENPSGAKIRLPYQAQVSRIYYHRFAVWLVALFIVGNFVFNIVEKEIDPSGALMPEVWQKADVVFNCVFLIELLVNMYGYGGPVKKFWMSGWNVFDTIVVTVGIVLMAGANLGPFQKLKLLRAFRVLRLGNRIESLKKILDTLARCIPGVLSTFLLIGMFFCIYAIIAVEEFRTFGDGGTYKTIDELGNDTYVTSVSMRGLDHGFEYYGTFMRAMYTLFQVMTGESWAEAVTRPLLFGLYQDSAAFVGIYFVTFIILVQVVLLNVFVAVLLDNFSEAAPESEFNIDASVLLNSHFEPVLADAPADGWTTATSFTATPAVVAAAAPAGGTGAHDDTSGAVIELAPDEQQPPTAAPRPSGTSRTWPGTPSSSRTPSGARTPVGGARTRQAGELGPMLDLMLQSLQRDETRSKQMAELTSQVKHLTTQVDTLTTLISKRDYGSGLGA